MTSVVYEILPVYKYAASNLREFRGEPSKIQSRKRIRDNHVILAKMLLNAQSDLLLGEENQEPWHVATTRPDTSFGLIKALLLWQSGQVMLEFSHCEMHGRMWFRVPEAIREFLCGQVLIHLSGGVVWDSLGGDCVRPPSWWNGDIHDHAIQLYAGNLQTLNAFYKLWETISNNAESPPNKFIHRQIQIGKPLILNFGGAVRGTIGTFKMAVYSEEMALVVEKEPEYGKIGGARFGKIWIDEKYGLELEMKDGKRWIRPVAGNEDEIDYDEIWTEAVDRGKDKKPEGGLSGEVG
jgi:hypothetical protein